MFPHPRHHRLQVLGGRVERPRGGPRVLQDRLEVAIGGGAVDPSHQGARVTRRARDGRRGVLDVAGDEVEAAGGAAGEVVELPHHPGEVLDALAHLEDGVGIERLPDPIGEGGDVARNAAGLRRELPDVGEGGTRPDRARLGRLGQHHPHVGIVLGIIEGGDRHRPLTEQARAGRDRRGVVRELHPLVELEIGLHPTVGRQADRLHPAHAHATERHRTTHLEPTHGAEPRGRQRFGGAQARLGEPERAGHDHGQRHQHHETDQEFIRALHVPTASAGASSGRPSMNWRTTGSSVAWISATVPTCRIRPSYSIAIRSPTV